MADLFSVRKSCSTFLVNSTQTGCGTAGKAAKTTRSLAIAKLELGAETRPNRASLNSIVSGADERTTIGRHVVTVVKASTVRRIGQPLLIANFVLALAGIAVSVVVMHFGAASREKEKVRTTRQGKGGARQQPRRPRT
jgi:hypothetical protein